MVCKQAKIPLKMFQRLLLYSFGYCVEQRTLCIFDCVDDLKKHWDILPVNYQRQIHAYINEKFKEDKENPEKIQFGTGKWREVLTLQIKTKGARYEHKQ